MMRPGRDIVRALLVRFDHAHRVGFVRLAGTHGGYDAVDAPGPVSVVAHVMEARGLRQKDLAASIGSQPHGSEVLGRQRPLMPSMIPALSAEGNLPADLLVRECDLAATR